MAVVRRRAQVYQDIAEIWSYVTGNSNSARADKLVEQFETKAKAIAKRPGMGRSREELMSSLRSFTVGRYVLFYVPLENGIDIVRIIHGARDIVSQFTTEDI